MSFFKRHLFICTNARHDACRKSCNDNGCGNHAADFLRERAKVSGLMGPGKWRISNSGCLGRCEQGPAMVIYPEGRWYRYENDADLQEIFDSEMMQNQPVSRLLIDGTPE